MKIFGILNITPDSFSDGNKYLTEKAMQAQVEKLIADGADVIDIGGESTRPGAELVDVQTELSRVEPIIRYIKENYQVQISIDTYKPEVAARAVELGVDFINDVRGSYCNHKMLDLVIAADVKYVLMHNNPQFKKTGLLGKEAIDLINNDCQQAIDYLKNSNYDLNKLILDPGIGFNKTAEQSLSIIANMEYYRQTNSYELLLGTSRKSCLQLASKIEVASQRDIPTVVTSIFAENADIDYIRVHDVQMNKQGIDTFGVINGYRK